MFLHSFLDQTKKVSTKVSLPSKSFQRKSVCLRRAFAESQSGRKFADIHSCEGLRDSILFAESQLTCCC